MKLKKYFALMRAGFMDLMVYRAGIVISFFGNIIYLVIIYFLWKAIFASSPADTVGGMTFTDTMIYLALAAALFNFIELYLVWEMGRSIQTGEIILQLIKPVPYPLFMFFSRSGELIVSFFMSFLPTFIIIYFVTGGAIPLGINILYFAAAVLLAVIINFNINFFVGTICLHTESIWGINITKETIILLFSGATVPLAFFPEPLKTIAEYMPFQAIFNTPMQMLINGNNLSAAECGSMLLVQAFWIFTTLITAMLFWKISLKKIMVNGG